MAGVPADVKDAAAAAAKAAGLPAGTYAIANTRSAVEPVLSFGTNRALREKVWQAFVKRGDNGNANDNNAIDRQDREAPRRPRQAARLCDPCRLADAGHDGQVAGQGDGPDEARLAAAVARVNEEVADMKPFAAKDGVTTIEPWDYRYYQEKVRKAKYDLSQDEIKPYFELNNLVNGMFWSAEQLYDLKFTENTGKVPVFQAGHAHLRGDQRQDRRGDRPVLPRHLCPQGQALGRLGDHLPQPRGPARRQDRARLEQ